MRKNLLFSPKQFGIISGRSTTLQLLYVLDKWTEILDNGGNLDCVYLDFMKAFDKVPHHRLQYKLHRYGISPNIVNWIQSFLYNRKQRVRVMNSYSEWAPVTSGIPQGSVLGPILFVIYINHLPDNLNSDCYMFADDTKVFNEIRCDEDSEKLQHDMEELENWSDKWLLRFHPDKCKVLSAGKRKTRRFEYKLCNTKLQYTEKEKDIGVVMDNQLNFKDHMNEKINKANSIMGLIRRTFTYLDESAFLMLYNALVRPHLECANAIWNPYKKKHITALENVQRRATKLIPGYKELSYEERLRKLKLPILAFRRKRADMIEVFKLTSGIYDTSLPPILKMNKDTITRGHSKKIYSQRANKDIRKNFFTFRTTQTWNNLPENVINAKTKKLFESRLDRYWKNQDNMYNYEANLTTGTEIQSYEEDEDLSKVVNDQSSEEDL